VSALAILAPCDGVLRSGTVRVVVADLDDARDRDLVRRLADGDEDAFRGLFRRYAPNAQALALRVVRQPFLAEEIVQDAFLALWRNPGGFDPARGSFRAWLLSLVHHRAVDLVRREESQRRRAEAAGAEPDPAGGPDPAEEVAEDLDRQQDSARVRSALDVLPPEQRAVIELMYFGGLSQSMIADRLSLPLGTVKSRTLLGMRRLRTVMVQP
jgi:RNA polymerase sigma factor (sigma-70 family)